MHGFVSRIRCGIALLSLGLVTVTAPSVLAQASPAAPVAAKVPEPLPPIPAGAAVLIVDTPEGAADTEVLLQRRVNTHIASLRSEQNLRQMISNANSETRTTSWFTSANDPHERTIWLRDHLHVKQIDGTPLIEVSLPEVASASDRRTILKDICETYLARVSKDRIDALGDRSYTLNTIKIKIEAQLKQITAEMRQKQINLNLDGGGVGRFGMKEMELSKLIAESVEAQLKSDQANAAYKTLAQAQQNGQNLPGLDALVHSDARIQEFQRRLDDAELKLEIAKAKAETAAGGSDKPAAKAPVAKDSTVKELQVETEYLRSKLDKLTSEAESKGKVALLEQSQARMTELKDIRDLLRSRVENLKAEIGDLNNSLILYRTLEEEQKGLRGQLKSVRDQIEQIMALQGTRALAGIRWHLMPEADLAK
jgi:hypothetical protein